MFCLFFVYFFIYCRLLVFCKIDFSHFVTSCWLTCCVHFASNEDYHYYNLRKCAVRNGRIEDVATAIAATFGSSGVPTGCRRNRRCSATDYDACSATAVCTVRGCSPERSSPPFLLQRLPKVWWSTRDYFAREIYVFTSANTWCIYPRRIKTLIPFMSTSTREWCIDRVLAPPPRYVFKKKSEINLLREQFSRVRRESFWSLDRKRALSPTICFLFLDHTHVCFLACSIAKKKTCKSSQVYVTRPLLRENREEVRRHK